MFHKEQAIEYIQGLRDLADFMEANPELASASTYSLFASASPTVYVWDDEDLFRERLRQLGTFEKFSDANHVGGLRRFGPHVFSVRAAHELVCERVVVGVETQLVYPDDVDLVEQEVEIVEWVCPESLLRESA